MIASTTAEQRIDGGLESSDATGIRLKISPAAREDAWDLCRVAIRCSGRGNVYIVGLPITFTVQDGTKMDRRASAIAHAWRKVAELGKQETRS